MNRKRLVVEVDATLSAQQRATEGVRGWLGMRLRVRHADADEPPDPIELVGYSAVRQDIVAKPTGCMDCPERSDACDNCKLSDGDSDDEDNRELARLITLGVLAKFAGRQQEGAYLGQMLQVSHYHEGLHDLFFAAPAFRGLDRVAAELQTRRRMNF